MMFTLPALQGALPATNAVSHTDSHTQLIVAALLGIATIIVLIVWRKMHPFLALTLGSAVLAVVAALAAVDQLFLWMERRGWIYWRRRKRDPRGALLGPIDNVFNPAHEHVVEQQETQERLADTQGDAAPR